MVLGHHLIAAWKNARLRRRWQLNVLSVISLGGGVHSSGSSSAARRRSSVQRRRAVARRLMR